MLFHHYPSDFPRMPISSCPVQNLGFMSRLGLWGHGTEHDSFNQWLDSIDMLGTGCVELNAMFLKAIGALQARYAD